MDRVIKCNLLSRGRVVMRPAVNRRPERRWFDPSRLSKLHSVSDESVGTKRRKASDSNRPYGVGVSSDVGSEVRQIR